MKILREAPWHDGRLLHVQYRPSDAYDDDTDGMFGVLFRRHHADEPVESLEELRGAGGPSPLPTPRLSEAERCDLAAILSMLLDAGILITDLEFHRDWVPAKLFQRLKRPTQEDNRLTFMTLRQESPGGRMMFREFTVDLASGREAERVLARWNSTSGDLDWGTE